MPPTTRQVFARALRLRCPRCGEGKIFRGFYSEKPVCESCGLTFEPRAGDTWGFLYLTNAAFVAPLAIALLILKSYGAWYSHWVTGAILSVLIIATLPYRKAAAIAVNYLVDRNPEEESA